MLDKELLRHLFDRYPASELARFKQFHADNPAVYSEFKSLAMKMKNSGREHYSAEAILQVLRWHRDLKTTGDEFKISNNFRSMYSRLLTYNHPEFLEFFSFHNLPPEITEAAEYGKVADSTYTVGKKRQSRLEGTSEP